MAKPSREILGTAGAHRGVRRHVEGARNVRLAPSPEGYTLFGVNDTSPNVRYDSFRLPAIIATTPGTLVAFADGRIDNERDWGNDPAAGGTIWLLALRTDGSVTDFDQVTWDNRQVYVLSKTAGADGVPGVEGTVAEKSDGSLYRNDRPGKTGFLAFRRYLSGKLSGGYSDYKWHDGHEVHDKLTEPTADFGCQGSLPRYNFDGTHRLMFLRPSNLESRRDMKISIGYDDGTTWDKISRLIPHPTGWGSDIAEGG
jgi:hypothetical protein